MSWHPFVAGRDPQCVTTSVTRLRPVARVHQEPACSSEPLDLNAVPRPARPSTPYADVSPLGVELSSFALSTVSPCEERTNAYARRRERPREHR